MAEKPKRFPGPWAIEFVYSVLTNSQALEHHLELNCKVVGDPLPGTSMLSINVQRAGGGTQAASVCVSDFWTQYRFGHTASMTGISATLWKYTPGTYEKQFYSAFASPLGAGTGGGGVGVGHQTQITLRTSAGSYMRVNWFEDNSSSQTEAALAVNATGTASQRMAAYLLSVNGWAVGRDGSFPIAPMRQMGTNNEAIERKRYRPNT